MTKTNNESLTQYHLIINIRLAVVTLEMPK